MNKEDEMIAEVMKAMGHPVRVAVVRALAKREMCVSALNELVHVKQSTLSRHLSQLKQSGLVAQRRDGVFVRHRLVNPCVERLLKCSHEVMACRIDRERKERQAI